MISRREYNTTSYKLRESHRPLPPRNTSRKPCRFHSTPKRRYSPILRRKPQPGVYLMSELSSWRWTATNAAGVAKRLPHLRGTNERYCTVPYVQGLSLLQRWHSDRLPLPAWHRQRSLFARDVYNSPVTYTQVQDTVAGHGTMQYFTVTRSTKESMLACCSTRQSIECQLR